MIVVINYSNQTVYGQLSGFEGQSERLSLTEPWRTLKYEVNGRSSLEVKMYPYEYRFIEFLSP